VRSRRQSARAGKPDRLHERISNAAAARAADLLVSGPAGRIDGDLGAAEEESWADDIEATEFGAARRLRSPVTIGGTPMHWDRPAVKLGSSAPTW
jgi:hypothetical protein